MLHIYCKKIFFQNTDKQKDKISHNLTTKDDQCFLLQMWDFPYRQKHCWHSNLFSHWVIRCERFHASKYTWIDIILCKTPVFAIFPPLAFFLSILFLKKHHLFMAVLDLCRCAQALSSCGDRRLLSVAVRGLLIAEAPLVEHRLWARRLSRGCTRA